VLCSVQGYLAHKKQALEVTARDDVSMRGNTPTLNPGAELHFLSAHTVDFEGFVGSQF